MCYKRDIVIDDDDYDIYYFSDERRVRLPDFRGYSVSNKGRVYGPGSLGRKGYHELYSYSNDKYGHQVVDLYVDGKRRHKYVHRLVAEMFIPNPENYPEVRHKDGNPLNNDVGNLEWGTHLDNMKDSQRHGTFHYFTPEEDEMALQVLRTPVKAINVETLEEKIYISQAEAARDLNLYQPNIRHVLCGKYKQTGGYRFEYVEKGDWFYGRNH